MSTLEIIEVALSIVASILAIFATVKAKNNEAEIKKIKQEIRENQIENSSINQAAGDIVINKVKEQ